MDSFERAFDDTEKAADSILKAATELARLARRLQKEARNGNISAIKKACSSLDSSSGSLRQTVANAVATWPFKDEEEEKYLREHYAQELRDTAIKMGLNMREKDGVLISHPSIVQVLAVDRAVRVDRKKVATLRPSYLAGILQENQKRPPRFRPEAFLNALYERYSSSAKTQPPTLDGRGPVVLLARIYEAFTSLPGSKREYSKIDFARDLYFLEDKGPLSTKSGARVSFPSSTGARKAKDTFTFVSPDGQTITYYGIQFSGGA